MTTRNRAHRKICDSRHKLSEAAINCRIARFIQSICPCSAQRDYERRSFEKRNGRFGELSVVQAERRGETNLSEEGDASEQKLAWVRQAAGERFEDLELSLMLTVVTTEDRQRTAEQVARARGWSGISVEQVLEMPSIVIGSVEQIVEQLHQRRERYGFSYYLVSDQHMHQFALVVAQLVRFSHSNQRRGQSK